MNRNKFKKKLKFFESTIKNNHDHKKKIKSGKVSLSWCHQVQLFSCSSVSLLSWHLLHEVIVYMDYDGRWISAAVLPCGSFCSYISILLLVHFGSSPSYLLVYCYFMHRWRYDKRHETELVVYPVLMFVSCKEQVYLWFTSPLLYCLLSPRAPNWEAERAREHQEGSWAKL